jgi:hypothetical protein
VRIRAIDEAVPMLGAVLSYGAIVAPLQRVWFEAVAREPHRLSTRFGTPVTALKRVPGGVEVDAGIAEPFDLAVVAEGGAICPDGVVLAPNTRYRQYVYHVETNTIGIEGESIRVDDIIETTNHFRCIDLIIDRAEEKLSEGMIKELHSILKSGTSDSRKDWFAVGEYKRLPNEVGGFETTAPENVHKEIKSLLKEYNSIKRKSLEDIIDLHQRFESIHPFQDGNGRVGRLIMFKECLASGHVPFIITEDLKMFYYRGLREWNHIREFLRDTCLTAQDNYKALLDYFRIKY